jgi:hypothetical protein
VHLERPELALFPPAAPDAPDAPDAGGAEGAAIGSDNVGKAMLQKLGWKEGAGLGRHAQGVTAPVSAAARDGRAGLGAVPAVPRQLRVAASDDRRTASWKKTAQVNGGSAVRPTIIPAQLTTLWCSAWGRSSASRLCSRLPPATRSGPTSLYGSARRLHQP